MAQCNASLERLQTDRVDLQQRHAVGDLDQLNHVCGPDGALAAAVRAQQEGLVGAVGITGHTHRAPSTHLEALRPFPLATVIVSTEPGVVARRAVPLGLPALAAEVQGQDAGPTTIETVSRSNWPVQGARQRFATWYEPYADRQQISAAVSWVLSHEEDTGIPTAGDVRPLGPLLAVERDRISLADAERRL